MPPRSPELTFLARATCLQVAFLFIGTTWAFGGNADWVQPYVAAGGGLGAAISLAAALAPERSRADTRRWRALLPLALFNAVALLGAAHPGFRPIRLDGRLFFLPRFVPAWQPSAALPRAVWPALRLFDALYLSAFNLFLLVHSRRALRALLLVLVGDAAALAVFGTVQKLTHASGLYFGRVRSPQSYFFSTFVYDNHWGAFIVLMAGAALGLAWHYAARPSGRNFFHAPGFASLFAVVLMAATVPLSGARICSVLLLALAAEAVLRWSLRQRARQNRRAARRALLGGLAALACGLAAVWYVGQDVIPARLAATRRQVGTMLAERNIGSRSELYEDTWRMAEDRPWFGWGMGSYPWVFQLYNRQGPNPRDLLPRVYHDAHSDWLQALAEHGAAGFVLLVLCGVAPLGLARVRGWPDLSRQALTGCALILAYAAVEFPFGNTAVVLAWWTLFFGALRYAELSAPPDPPSR